MSDDGGFALCLMIESLESIFRHKTALLKLSIFADHPILYNHGRVNCYFVLCMISHLLPFTDMLWHGSSEETTLWVTCVQFKEK
jgi:hypothetical protein